MAKKARARSKKTSARKPVTRKAAAKRKAAKRAAPKKAAKKRTTKKAAPRKAAKARVKKTARTRSMPPPVVAPPVLAPAAVAPAVAPALVAPAAVTQAAGFDTGSYPGDAAIAAWAASSPYAFVGFYFDAPCHTPATFKSWAGKASFIQGTGLGLAIVYVGLQQDGCGKNKLSRANGTAHGQDTIAKFAAEGFAQGTTVFLDVEAFTGALSANMAAYVQGWVGALLDDGRVNPGIYCPAAKASALRVAAQQEYAAHGQPDDAPAFWIVKVGDPQFDPTSSAPTDCGVAFANVWQGVIDTSETHGGVTLSIDRNVADTTDPSGA
jgi:Domain of unknown function (DUF1906)